MKKQGKVVKLRKPISTTRGDRLIGQLPAHNLGEDAPKNATAPLQVQLDDAVHWKKPDARKKEMKKYLADYLKRIMRKERRGKEETRDAKDYGTNVMFLLERFVTKSDLSQIEKYADRLFAKVGIDVEFTRHFVDRVNDEQK